MNPLTIKRSLKSHDLEKFCEAVKPKFSPNAYKFSLVKVKSKGDFLRQKNVKNLQKINERELELGIIGKKSWHDEYKDSAWIFIGGLPYDLSEGDVVCVFSQYGEVVNVNLVRDHKSGKSKGFAFLCYEDQRSTILSVDNLNGAKILGRTLRVDHVKEYKVPKEYGDEDELVKKIREEGCAPTLPSSSEEEAGGDVKEEDADTAKIKKVKKKKKEKKIKKQKKSSSESSSSSGSDEEKPSPIKNPKHKLEARGAAQSKAAVSKMNGSAQKLKKESSSDSSSDSGGPSVSSRETGSRKKGTDKDTQRRGNNQRDRSQSPDRRNERSGERQRTVSNNRARSPQAVIRERSNDRNRSKESGKARDDYNKRENGRSSERPGARGDRGSGASGESRRGNDRERVGSSREAFSRDHDRERNRSRDTERSRERFKVQDGERNRRGVERDRSRERDRGQERERDRSKERYRGQQHRARERSRERYRSSSSEDANSKR